LAKRSKAPIAADLSTLARAADEIARRFWSGEKILPSPAFFESLAAHERLDPEDASARAIVTSLARLAGHPGVIRALIQVLAREPDAWGDPFFRAIGSAPEPGREDLQPPVPFPSEPSFEPKWAKAVPPPLARSRLQRFPVERESLVLAGKVAPGPHALAFLAALLAGDEPDAAWSERARAALRPISDERTKALASALFEAVPAFPLRPSLGEELRERLIWLAVHTATSSDALRALADDAAGSARSGDPQGRTPVAIVRALAHLAPERAVPELERLRARVKHKVVLKAIDAALETLASSRGTTRAALEEENVPGFGLSAAGERAFPDEGLVLALDREGANVWRASDPSSKKKPKPSAELLKLAKSLSSALSIQRSKLEEALVSGRTWDLASFQKSFLERPLLAHLGRRVLFCVKTDARRELAFLQGASLVDLSGEPVTPATDATLSLAHPIDLAPEELERARDRLCALGIVQPWKQVFRETYAPTEPERMLAATERFAGQLVPHGKLYALARVRGWSGFACIADGTFEGTRTFSPSLRARLLVDPGDETKWDERARAIRLDELRFESKSGRRWEPELIARIPPVVFSEACRDVDLFAALGDDASSGRTTEEIVGARTALLERVLPALGLGDRVSLDGHFLRVKGELHSYKVHLGSAHAFIEPAGRFLAFPREARAPEIYLPEEASTDPRTVEILGRALVLAGDLLVADPLLARQIGEA
jgi:hypothetical protein